ncbi:hypothetical protein [Streptomyces sp. NPDC127098]|uniref:hypothetical protein n=1 Tax=Streptomyces sp. NPDC127098 TaxID=3347137 RepID=UPI0036607601
MLQLVAVVIAFVALLLLVGATAGSLEVLLWLVLLALTFSLVIRHHRRRTTQ